MRRRINIAPVYSDFASQKVFHKCDTPDTALRLGRVRLLVVLAGFWVVVLLGRLYCLQVYNCDRWQISAVKQHSSHMKIASERGPVFDRNDRILAVSVPAGSIYVRPANLEEENIEEVAARLSEVLEMTPDQVQKRFTKDAPFVWIKRQVPRVVAEKVTALEIPGVGFVIEPRRYYPFNESGSSLIGKVGIDGNGLSGIEAAYEKRLHQAHLKTKVTRDALGKKIQDFSNADDFRLPKGNALSLTIDARIQMIISEEVRRGRADTKAEAVVAVMIDAASGDILGMSQAPEINFNTDKVKNRLDLSNRVIETVYEPGSTMKPIIAASVLDLGLVSPTKLVNCENGRFRIGRHIINDVHPHEELSVHDVIVRSSNIGITKLGMLMGRDRLYQTLRQFGFGQSPNLNLPGETKGILRSPDGWAEVDVATHSFGQGIAVTPLQMVRAIGAIANGGHLTDLRLVKDSNKVFSSRIISEEASSAVREMLFSVVEDEHGTGKRASIKGVRIGGKTGTAQKAKVDGRGYQSGVYVASFIGFADATSLGIRKIPTLIVLVDEPNSTSIYGGTLAGPVFKRIMERTLHLLATEREIRQDSEDQYINPQLDQHKPLNVNESEVLRVAYQY